MFEVTYEGSSYWQKELVIGFLDTEDGLGLLGNCNCWVISRGHLAQIEWWRARPLTWAAREMLAIVEAGGGRGR